MTIMEDCNFSQEEQDKIIGDMNRVQRNDFTKIMARFKQSLLLQVLK